MFIIYHSHTLVYLNAPYAIIVSKIIVFFQQTLKDVEHVYRDIAGFDMFYDEFKELCREAWKEKFTYFLINRLEVKNGKNTGFVMNLVRSIKSLIHKRIFFEN